MDSLVGYTGFVGSNLDMQHDFAGRYHSQNIGDAFYTKPDLLVYAGVRAEKFLANRDPAADLEMIESAIDNIKKIQPRKLVLLSTIDVYDNPNDADEDTPIDAEKLEPYGRHRYQLERWVEQNTADFLIVRLPALYGKNLKKNFIFDLIHSVPSLLTQEKFSQLKDKINTLPLYYHLQRNGFYRIRQVSLAEREQLKHGFAQAGFSALQFTDSRGLFQFYHLKYLWRHLQIAMQHHVKKLNIAVEPVNIAELYWHIRARDFENQLLKPIPHYRYRTKHAALFGGEKGYLFEKKFVMDDVKQFVEENR